MSKALQKHLEKVEAKHKRKRALNPKFRDRVPLYHSLQIVGKYLFFNGKHSIDKIPVQLTKTNLKKLGDTNHRIEVKPRVIGKGKNRYLRYAVHINYNFNQQSLLSLTSEVLGRKISKLMSPHFLKIEMLQFTKYGETDYIRVKGRILKDVRKQ